VSRGAESDGVESSGAEADGVEFRSVEAGGVTELGCSIREELVATPTDSAVAAIAATAWS